MTKPKRFKNESQDARRRDQHNATHPFDDKHLKNKKVDEQKSGKQTKPIE